VRTNGTPWRGRCRSRRVGNPRGTGFAATSPRACKNPNSPDTLDNRRRTVRADTPPPSLPDWLGSVATVVSAQDQSLAAYDYDAYGNPRTGGTAGATPSAVDNPIRFAGLYLDATLGARYTTPARSYDPGTGRFAGADPSPQSGTTPALSTYAYANDDPTSLTDPVGADPCSTGGQGCNQYDPTTHTYKPCGPHVSPDTCDLINNYTGGGTAPPPTNTVPDSGTTDLEQDWNGNYTRQHNAARDIAAYWLRTRTWYNVYIEFPIAHASKKLTGNTGYADIAAHDDIDAVWFIWEVKHIGGVNGEAGAEAQGPADVLWYIQKLKDQFPGQTVRPGMTITTRLMQPNPDNPKQTLVTTSSTALGRPASYAGVIVYWTKKRDDTDDDTRAVDKQKEEQAKAKAQADHDPPKHSLPYDIWEWLISVGRDPQGVPAVPEPIVEPVLVP
jgi:RHS repeat-associated protein